MYYYFLCTTTTTSLCTTAMQIMLIKRGLETEATVPQQWAGTIFCVFLVLHKIKEAK